MRRLFILLAAAFCLLAAGTRASAQVPILYYDFENNANRAMFDNAAEQSVNGGSGALTRSDTDSIGGTAGAGIYNGGSATGQAASTNGWQNTAADPTTGAADYFQFVANTQGFSQISVTFDNQASGSGPAAVGLMYSTDGTNFTSVTPVATGNALVAASSFNTAVFDLSGVPAVDNQSSVTIRIYAYAGDRTGRNPFSALGTFRIDNLTVRAATVTASKTLLDYPAVGLSTRSGAAFTPAYTSLSVNGSGATATLNGDLKLTGTLNVVSGTLDQGAASNLTAGAVSVAAGGTLRNQGAGDLSLGSGGVFNDGTVNFNGGGTPCDAGDDILIRSTAAGAQRTWAGAGAFWFVDVDVSDQRVPGAPDPPLAIVAVSSKDSGNNTGWTFPGDSSCSSGSYTWAGGAGNDWQNPASWSPARLVPSATDVLTFDGSLTPAPTAVNVPTETVATLKLANAAAVTLNAASLSAPQTLTLSGAQALLVPAGTSLTLSGGSALRLNVADGSAAAVGGAVVFEGGAHRLIGNASAAVTFQGGATFGTASDFSGNPFGTGAAGDGAAGSVVFASGSGYFHNGGESPFGTAGAAAVAVFQTGSTATWLTSGGFQAGGRTYADLVVGKSDPGGLAVSVSEAGAGDFQFDNLTVKSTGSANSSLSFLGTGSSTVTVRGNITSTGEGFGTFPDVTLGGGAGGVRISKPGGGTVTFGSTGNARAVDFESHAAVAPGTTLSLGRVLVAGLNASSNLVVSVEAGGDLGGSASGYVVGKLRRQLSGTGAGVFHVGTLNGYSPVTLNITSNVNDSPVPFTVSAASAYMAGISPQSKSLKRTYTLTKGASTHAVTADVAFRYVAGPTSSFGDVSADVVEGELNPYRRNGGGGVTEFPAASRGANTVSVAGLLGEAAGFSNEWTLASLLPCSLTVSNTADSGAGSLRETLTGVCAGGAVGFAPALSGQTISLTGGELVLHKNVTVAGPGAGLLTVRKADAAADSRVFNVPPGVTATLSGLTVSNGKLPADLRGGGIFNGGALTLSGVAVTGNTAGYGGGISSGWALTLIDSTVGGNTATSEAGGGINISGGSLTATGSTVSGNTATYISGMGGGIYAAAGAAILLTNCTVSGNTSNHDGGGLYVTDLSSAALTNCTVTGNRSDANDDGSGVGGGFAGGTGTLPVLRNTVVAGNYKGSGTTAADDLNRAVNASSSFNLIGVCTSCGLTDGVSNNRVGVSDPQLGPLAANGGPTKTHRPLPGGPAVGAGGNVTVLAGALDETAITVTVADASAVPAGVGFAIRVDDERMVVRGKSGNTLTVERGAGGTAAAAHADGAGVSPAFDQRGLARLVNAAFDVGAVEVNYAVSATAGTPQSVGINAAFAAPLKATVTESGSPAAGVSVSFAAPASGATGAFAAAATVTTGADGVATAPALTASGTAGSYTVTASLAGGSPSADFSLTNAKGVQAITFGALAGRTFGDASFTVGATGGASGNAVTFTSQTTAVCTVSGNTVTILAAGACTIRASQAGNDNYDAAPNVDNSFQIAKATSTTTVTCPGSVTYDGSPQTPCTATVAGAGGLSWPVTPLTYSDNVNAGTATASASYGGDSNHEGSSDTENFSIVKAAQVINFGPLAARAFGDAPFAVSATGGGSGLAVTFAAAGKCASGGANGSTITITGAGDCTVTASQAGDANYEAAASVSRSFQTAKAATTTAVSAAPNPSGFGQSVTLTATVASAAGAPTGAVTFRNGGTAVGGCEGRTLSAVGLATCTTSALAAGGHAVTAEYSGDANFLASAGALSGVQRVGGVFEFSRALYTVAERGGQVAVTVRRTGDTTQAASVDYSTEDGSTPSVAVACSAATGLALERCDYTRAAGTIRFAAGEAEKTFVVLVGDDSFNEGTETTALRLSNPSAGATLGGLSAAALEITDDATDAEAAANVTDDDEAFVRQHYHDFLNREPDAEGLKFWTDGIGVCGADAGCREVKRVHTSAAFFLSIEFQQTGYFAYLMHKAAFGDLAADRPVPVALADFLRDTQRVGEGVVVNQGDWQARLEANRRAYALEFVGRPQFLTRYPALTSATAFVNQLDADAGGVLSPDEKAALVAELSPNPSDAALRASVLRKVADNAALVQREKNRAFVLMQYVGYLRRNPNDAPEEKLDFSGYGFWLSKLEEFGGDFVRAEMVKAFISSVEYRGRFGR